MACLTVCEGGAIKATSRISFGGAVAQLGARLDGIEEVRGSNPLGSTKKTEKALMARPVTRETSGLRTSSAPTFLNHAHDAKSHVIVLRCTCDEGIGRNHKSLD
jgi:hypothetical protein